MKEQDGEGKMETKVKEEQSNERQDLPPMDESDREMLKGVNVMDVHEICPLEDEEEEEDLAAKLQSVAEDEEMEMKEENVYLLNRWMNSFKSQTAQKGHTSI